MMPSIQRTCPFVACGGVGAAALEGTPCRVSGPSETSPMWHIPTFSWGYTLRCGNSRQVPAYLICLFFPLLYGLSYNSVGCPSVLLLGTHDRLLGNMKYYCWLEYFAPVAHDGKYAHLVYGREAQPHGLCCSESHRKRRLCRWQQLSLSSLALRRQPPQSFLMIRPWPPYWCIPLML